MTCSNFDMRKLAAPFLRIRVNFPRPKIASYFNLWTYGKHFIDFIKGIWLDIRYVKPSCKTSYEFVFLGKLKTNLKILAYSLKITGRAV